MKFTYRAEVYTPARHRHTPARYEVGRCLHASALAHDTKCTNYVLFLRLCYLILILIADLTARVENIQRILIIWHVL
jgi:hypothetical protein